MTQSRNSALYLSDILENIQNIELFTEDGKDAFFHSIKTQYAVLKCLENIGEAVKNIPLEYKKLSAYPNWRSAAGTRDILIHHYFSVDTNLVWNIVSNDIPLLKSAVQQIISQIEQKNPPSEDQGMSM